MRITILAFPRVQLLDVVGPADVFAEAAKQLGNPRAYRVKIIGTEKGMIKGSSGLKLGIDVAIETYKGKTDTLLVAGSPHIDEIALNLDLLHWLRQQANSVRRLGSVCSGAFLLAAAGLLDGRRVTTHWNASAKLAKEYPLIQVDPDSIYIKDGSIYTSAGVTAGMDLALALVEEDHGRELAFSVAREMVMFFKRPGGQSQFSAQLATQAAESTVIRQLQEFVLCNLKKDLSVPVLAIQAGMSERNFARIFKQETDSTPADFVELARIDAARRLIEKTDVSLKRLADDVGYANIDGFRRAFTRRLGIGPNEYRKRFFVG